MEHLNLNKTVWCTLAPSTTHGVGVFAIRDIQKGQKVYLQLDRQLLEKPVPEDTLPEIKEIIESRWHTPVYLHPHADAWMLAFINSSPDPNYDEATDTALNDIKRGEELYSHYDFTSTSAKDS